jgi:NitT/TauT family transport system permease protein
LLGLGLLATLWEGSARLGLLNSVILSSPTKVAEAFARQLAGADLLRDLQISAGEFAIGFGLATVTGIAVGAAMGLRSEVKYALEPFVWLLYAVPLVAFFPLIIVWLGFGFWTVVALAALLSFVPVAVNTLSGFQSVDPIQVRAVRSFGCGGLGLVTRVLLPAALPLVLAGLRVGVGRALIGVVAGEMFGANAGLGYRLTYYGARLRTSDLLVEVGLIMLLGLLATQAIRLLEYRLTGWRRA